jgi:hypothetical protein
MGFKEHPRRCQARLTSILGLATTADAHDEASVLGECEDVPPAGVVASDNLQRLANPHRAQWPLLRIWQRQPMRDDSDHRLVSGKADLAQSRSRGRRSLYGWYARHRDRQNLRFPRSMLRQLRLWHRTLASIFSRPHCTSRTAPCSTQPGVRRALESRTPLRSVRHALRPLP